jgi:hypothetical protein
MVQAQPGPFLLYAFIGFVVSLHIGSIVTKMVVITNLTVVLIAQVIYIIILGSITYGVKKTGRKQGLLYWFTVLVNILYGLTFGWLFYRYSAFSRNPDPGKVFTWRMYSFIVPGVLILALSIVFIQYRLSKKGG